MKSNSNKLTGWLNGTSLDPVRLEEEEEEPVHIREESDSDDDSAHQPDGRSKRTREDSDEALFVGDFDISEDEGFQAGDTPALKRRKIAGLMGQGEEDEKKKLGVNTSYDGFSIYGRILCLLVKRRGKKVKGRLPGAATDETGQQMLEGWISTQAAAEQIIDDD